MGTRGKKWGVWRGASLILDNKVMVSTRYAEPYQEKNAAWGFLPLVGLLLGVSQKQC